MSVLAKSTHGRGAKRTWPICPQELGVRRAVAMFGGMRVFSDASALTQHFSLPLTLESCLPSFPGSPGLTKRLFGPDQAEAQKHWGNRGGEVDREA